MVGINTGSGFALRLTVMSIHICFVIFFFQAEDGIRDSDM